MIVLRHDECELVLRPHASNWCRVELRHNGGLYDLGAEDLAIILARLSNALRDDLDGEFSGDIDGVRVVWVLSLAERHTTFYATDRLAKRSLFIQGADGTTLARLDLGASRRREWLESLEAATSERTTTKSRRQGSRIKPDPLGVLLDLIGLTRSPYVDVTPTVENPYGRIFLEEADYYANPFVEQAWPCFLTADSSPRVNAPYFDSLRKVALELGDAHLYVAEEGDPSSVVAVKWDLKALSRVCFDHFFLGRLMFGDSGRWAVLVTDQQFSFIGGDVAVLSPVIAALGGPMRVRSDFELWIADALRLEEISNEGAERLCRLNEATRSFDELLMPT